MFPFSTLNPFFLPTSSLFLLSLFFSFWQAFLGATAPIATPGYAPAPPSQVISFFQVTLNKDKNFREYKSGNKMNNMLNVSPGSCLQCRPTRPISSIFKRNLDNDEGYQVLKVLFYQWANALKSNQERFM